MTAPTLTRLLRAAAPCAAALVAAAGAPSSAAAQSAGDKVTYADQVLPIFRNACNGCHNPDKKKAGLDLTTYQAAIAGSDNGSMTNAGDPAGSMLYKVMTHAAEPTMPPKKDKLPAAELELVRKWIAGGLLETSGSKAAAGSKPKVDLSAVTVVGKPTGPIAFPAGLSAEPLVRTSRPGAVESLAASPWAPVLAVGGQRQVVLYHSASLDVLGVLPFPEGVPHVLRFSRNGSLLLAAGGTGAKLGKAVLYDVASGDRVTDVGDELDEVIAADLSPDQKLVALGGTNRLVKGYDVADGKELYSIKKHTDWVTAIAISPNGEYLASGDRAGNLYVWEAKTGGELYTLNGHKDSIDALAFRDDSALLLSASKDGTARLWEMAEGKSVKNWPAHVGGVTAAGFAHDGRIATAGRDKMVRVWSPGGDNGKPLGSGLNDIALHVAFDHDGGRVFAGDWSGLIRAWGVADGKPVGDVTPNPPPVADRLAAAERKLGEVEPAAAKAEAELKAAQAAA
ncbi:MAG: domain, G-beta repeat, partial [Phycisphaerales bacterium]|nr:domain, G-beta repeat [Phycisphaerales bacterium]